MNRLTKIEMALLLLASQTGSVLAGRKRGSGLAAMTSSKRPRSAQRGKKAPASSHLPKAS